MNKKTKIYVGIFIVILIAILYNDLSKPKPIDWSPSFLSTHKIPYGTYVLYKELPHFFPDNEIKKIRTTPYELFQENYNSYLVKDIYNTSYFFVNDYLDIDQESSKELFNFVDNGNDVFMAAHSFPKYIMDSLHIKVQSNFEVKTEILLKLANKKVSRTKYNYSKAIQNTYFSKLPKDSTTVLGYSFFDTDSDNPIQKINFVKIQYGSGNFILNTQPYAFTNYHLLKSNHAVYVRDCLTYLKDQTIFWDDHSKAQLAEIDSPLRFIFSKPALKNAWYLALFSALLFVIFRAKRRQRIVPIIKKLPNTSIAFAKTIGDMYFHEGEPKDIIAKKITYFLEHLRNSYLLDTQNMNSQFKQRLHLKSGAPKDEIDRLIAYIIDLSKNEEPKENSLITLNKIIDKFYNKTL